MSNPLYQSFKPQNNFIQALNQLKKNFSGDPQQKVQELLNSGKVTQAEYNEAVRKMQEIQRMM